MFGGVIPVYGKKGCALYDLRHSCVRHLNDGAYYVLKLAGTMSCGQIAKAIRCRQADVTDLLHQAVEEGFGFFTLYPGRFADMPLHWYSSSHVQQAIVDWSGRRYDLLRVIGQLDMLLCHGLEVRVEVGPHELPEVDRALDMTLSRTFRWIHLVINHGAHGECERWLDSYPALGRITLYGAPAAGIQKKGHKSIRYFPADMAALDRYDSRELVVNRRFFCESQTYNPYLNRRVCIDRDGEIRNAPSFPTAYGNVSQDDLTRVVLTPSFRELWNVNVDLMAGIRDSGFRYARFVSGLPVKLAKGEGYEIVPI